MNQKLSDEQVGLRNAEESNCQQQEKQGKKNKEIPEKKISTAASLTMLKPVSCGSQQTVENS